MKEEGGIQGSLARRYPKSGGFRRQLKTVDWQWLSQLLALLREPKVEAADLTPKPEPLTMDMELDEQGYPLIFAQVLADPDPDEDPMMMMMMMMMMMKNMNEKRKI